MPELPLSSTPFFVGAQELDTARSPQPAPPEVPRRPAPRWLVATVAAVACAGLVLGWFVTRRADDRPVVLPGSFAGLNPSRVDFAGPNPGGDGWRAGLREVLGSTPFGGRAYGEHSQDQPVINVVVVRRDTTGQLDLKMAAEPFIRRGAVTCTHTFDLPKLADQPSKPAFHETWLLCWRSSDRLTVSALSKAGPPDLSRTVEGVDTVWAANR